MPNSAAILEHIPNTCHILAEAASQDKSCKLLFQASKYHSRWAPCGHAAPLERTLLCLFERMCLIEVDLRMLGIASQEKPTSFLHT